MNIKKISSRNFILFIILILAIPLLLFLIGYTVYMEKFLDRKIAQVNQAKVDTYENFIREDLQQIEYFLSNLVANNPNVNALKYTETKLETHENTYILGEKYKDELMNYKILTGLYLFSVHNNLYRSYYQDGVTLDTQSELNEFMKKMTENEVDVDGWYVREIAGHFYLVRMFRTFDTYLAAVVDFDNISEVNEYAQLDSADSGKAYLIFIKDTTPLSFGEELEEKGIRVKSQTEGYDITGRKVRYIAVYRNMDYLNLTVAYFIPYRSRLSFEPSILILIAAIMTLLILLGICYQLLHRNYFIPLEEIIDTVNRVKAGEIHDKMEINSKIQEFSEVSRAFNSMVEQIVNLKIEAYEQKAVIQDTQLAYFQIQIRPHFYLNCLKNLYGMAQSRKYERIQEMIIRLSDYLRAMFSNNETSITIRQELNNITNYIALQQMSQTYPPEIQIEMKDGLDDFKIPPISILSFVENAIKHGTVMERRLKIQLKIRTIHDGSTNYLNIVIQDNGKGFPEDILMQLNGTGKLSGAGVGIQNVLQRFSLYYGEQQTVSFYNMSGACVDIYLQMNEEV